MNSPGTYNITLQRRADYSVQLVFKDANKVAIDLTGWTVAAQVWDLSRTTKYADFTVDYLNRPAGQVRLKLGYQLTAILPTETTYDVLLVNTSGVREYYLEGTIFSKEGYTTVP